MKSKINTWQQSGTEGKQNALFNVDNFVLYQYTCHCIKIFLKTPKAHSNSSEIFSYDLITTFSEQIIQSRTFASPVQTSWNQAHASILVESFPKTHQEHNLKHPDLVELITIKQNKLPSFIDRLPQIHIS